ncbi:MAG TPA: hypothetical protein PK677_14330 [Acidiphilium sp.]|nr:hypothetical protein [Acidiphilium sp.]
MKTLSIMDAVAEIVRAGALMVVEQHEAMEASAVLIEDRAKDIIGHYQTETGPFDVWKPLADSTRDEKQRLGYAPPDNPLLRTGEMRDSIGHDAETMRAVVGSDDDKAIWQELGTHGPNPGADGYHVPPRSFLGAAAFQKQDEVAELLGEAVVAAICGTQRKVISGR